MRLPSISRSLTQRTSPTVEARETRLEGAIRASEKKAAAKKEQLARAAAAKARKERIAAREAAQRRADAAKAREQAARAVAEAEAQDRAEQEALDDASATDAGTLRDMARTEMLSYGFEADQWTYLDRLIMRESSWNPQAENSSSGAYGLPQALPGSKMASAGADWKTNPVTQVKWMLGYIAERYTNPAGAWAHSEAVGWY